MAGASRLEDLDAWMKSKTLVKRIYKLTAVPPAKNDFAYCNQIRRATISIMSNIAEGFGRSTDKEFARFLDIARGSSFETQSLIHVANDVGYIEDPESKDLIKVSFEIIAMITSLSGYLRADSRSNVAGEIGMSDFRSTEDAPKGESDFGPLTSDYDSLSDIIPQERHKSLRERQQ